MARGSMRLLCRVIRLRLWLLRKRAWQLGMLYCGLDLDHTRNGGKSDGVLVLRYGATAGSGHSISRTYVA